MRKSYVLVWFSSRTIAVAGFHRTPMMVSPVNHEERTKSTAAGTRNNRSSLHLLIGA